MTGAGPASIADTTASASRVSNATELGVGGGVPGGGPTGIIGRGAGGPAWAGRALGRALGTARCGPCELLLEEWLELEVAGSVNGMSSGVSGIGPTGNIIGRGAGGPAPYPLACPTLPSWLCPTSPPTSRSLERLRVRPSMPPSEPDPAKETRSSFPPPAHQVGII